MEAVATKGAAIVPQLKPNQAFIMGRIDNVRNYEAGGKRVFEHRVLQPAEDAYSSPGAVLVQSPHKLGVAGDDVKVLCWATGWRDTYKDKDGMTIQTARNALRVVE